MKIKTIIGASILLVSWQVGATTLTFDDLGSAPINAAEFINNVDPNYGGFTWNNRWRFLQGRSYPGSGYDSGTVSGVHVGFISNRVDHEYSSISTASGYFDFNSVYLTAAWSDNLSANIEGWRDGTRIYSSVEMPIYENATLFNFDWLDIDELRFSTYGAIDHDPNDGGNGGQLVFDDFTYNQPPSAVPIPAAAWLFGTALIGLVGFGKRRKAV